jgi:hypothetical protein
MTVGRQPVRFAGFEGNGAAVESHNLRRFRVANTSLLPVVTF